MGAGSEPGLQQKRTDTTDAGTVTEIHDDLLEGVYDMQVRYRSSSGYVNADAVTDWKQVNAVRVDFLIRSEENNLVDSPMTLPYQLNDGSFFTAPDRHFYETFSTTIALRNRLP